jgi:hypothetical protein
LPLKVSLRWISCRDSSSNLRQKKSWMTFKDIT